MNLDDWERYRNEKLAEYPCQRGKWRFDLELSHPRATLREVPIERNPHGGILTGHTYFYCSYWEWSTIFAVWEEWEEEEEKCRFLVESGNSEPIWGERVFLFGTSQYIVDEPWGTNPANKFAFFRGKYWKVKDQFLHDYNELYQVMGGRIVQPIRSPVLIVAITSPPTPRQLELQTFIRRVRSNLPDGIEPSQAFIRRVRSNLPDGIDPFASTPRRSGWKNGF
jgi:hypothetical protein